VLSTHDVSLKKLTLWFYSHPAEGGFITSTARYLLTVPMSGAKTHQLDLETFRAGFKDVLTP
jgi:hypothetical protein